MTCTYMINRADEYKPNGYSFDEKMTWLYELEHTIQTEIIDTHENPDEHATTLVPGDTDGMKELVASDRESMYLFWLLSQIDLHNGDITRYNNDSALFNGEYSAYANEYNRRYMPRTGPKLRY